LPLHITGRALISWDLNTPRQGATKERLHLCKAIQV
jgi:hypothetical protein